MLGINLGHPFDFLVSAASDGSDDRGYSAIVILLSRLRCDAGSQFKASLDFLVTTTLVGR